MGFDSQRGEITSRLREVPEHIAQCVIECRVLRIQLKCHILRRGREAGHCEQCRHHQEKSGRSISQRLNIFFYHAMQSAIPNPE